MSRLLQSRGLRRFSYGLLGIALAILALIFVLTQWGIRIGDVTIRLGGPGMGHTEQRSESRFASSTYRSEDDSPAGRMVAAARDAELEIVRELLDDGVSPNAMDSNGDYPLHSAAGRNAVEVVTLLIAAGADINAPALNDHSPLMEAAFAGAVDAGEVLIQAGADVNRQYGETRVHALSQLLGGWLLGSGRMPSSLPVEERAEDRLMFAELLLEAGANPNLDTLDGPPLRHVLVLGDVDLLRLMLEHGAGVHRVPELQLLRHQPGEFGDVLREAFREQ